MDNNFQMDESMRDEGTKRYISLLLDESVLKDIDDFRFKHRFPSRTEAIRWLIEFALKQKPKPPH